MEGPYSTSQKRRKHMESRGEEKKNCAKKKGKALSLLFTTDEEDVLKQKAEGDATPKKKGKALFLFGENRGSKKSSEEELRT
jgi:hypothetical protein